LNGLRSNAYPFDWILSNINGIKTCVADNFSNFINYDYIEFKNTSMNFPYIENDFPCDNGNNGNNENNIELIRAKHKLYGFTFVHDFKSTMSDDLDKIKEKYERRINRFKNIMRSDIKKILFVIYHKNEINKIEELKELFNEVGYKSFIFKIKTHDEIPIGISWKREKFDWNKWLCE
jgi:hypothetical protein